MSTTPTLPKCPKCGQSVPDWAQVCQFCGTLIPGRQAVARAVVSTNGATGTRWQDVVYVIASVWWMLQGLRVVLVSLRAIPPVMAGPAAIFAPIVALCLAVGVFLTLVGLGLLCRVEIARGIANVLCWIQFLLCALGILGAIFGMAFTGLAGLLAMLMNLADLTAALFMVYLLGETDHVSHR